jgi:purine-nucleoside phosphorylase
MSEDANSNHHVIDPELSAAQTLITQRFDGHLVDTAIVLGSGLSEVARTLLQDAVVVQYSEIPGFPQVAQVQGHTGELHLGTIGMHRVAFFLGRNHLYQGLSARDVVFPVRLAAALGAEEVILTNAAGSLHEKYEPGKLMLIADQINLTGTTPLDMQKPIHTGSPFVSMSDAYSVRLRTEAQWTAKAFDRHYAEGTYLGLRGPQYETPAEAKYLRSLGAHAVGMSTVLETIAARAIGLKVLGVSLITNHAGGNDDHLSVLRSAENARQEFVELLSHFLHREELIAELNGPSIP